MTATPTINSVASKDPQFNSRAYSSVMKEAFPHLTNDGKIIRFRRGKNSSVKTPMPPRYGIRQHSRNTSIYNNFTQEKSVEDNDGERQLSSALDQRKTDFFAIRKQV